MTRSPSASWSSAEQPHAEAGECRQVEAVATRTHDGDGGPGLARVGQVARALIPVAAIDEPADEFPAAVHPRVAAHPTRRQKHPPARTSKIFGDLAPGLSASHDQHGTVGQLRGAGVLAGVQLIDARREPAGQRRCPRTVLQAAGQDDSRRADLVGWGPENELGPVVFQGEDVRVRMDGQRRGALAEQLDHLGAAGERPGSTGPRTVFIQPGVFSRKLSHRWLAQVSPTALRSSTTCSTPASTSARLADKPAAPAPTTTHG